MGFRDDGLASQERAEALEREVERLREENEALRQRPETAAGPAKRRNTVARAATPLFIGALMAGAGAAVVPIPPIRIVLALGAVMLLATAVLATIVGRLLHIVGPGEVLVLSGTRGRGPDGLDRGYRIITGGRVLQVPLLETASYLSLGPFPFTLDLRGLYTRDERIDLRASASITVDTRPDLVPNAVERFLGRQPNDMVEVARQTLEGVLRSVASELSLELLQSDADAVAERLLRTELPADLEKLGLALQTFVIEEVSAAREG